MKKKERKKDDFLVSSLPSSRKEQFFDIWKHNFPLLSAIGMVLFLFLLPLLASYFFKDISLFAAQNDILSEEAKQSAYFFANFLFYIFSSISIIIFSIGLSGVLPILKNLCYNEPIFFKEDFKEGIKTNFKPFLFLGLIAGIIALAEGLIGLFFEGAPWFEGVLFGINVILVFPIIFTSCFLSLFYENPFISTITKGASLYLRHVPLLLATLLTFLLPLLFDYIPSMIIKYPLLIALIIVYEPASLLFAICSHLHYFDEDINLSQFPDHYHRGLADFYSRRK